MDGCGCEGREDSAASLKFCLAEMTGWRTDTDEPWERMWGGRAETSESKPEIWSSPGWKQTRFLVTEVTRGVSVCEGRV